MKRIPLIAGLLVIASASADEGTIRRVLGPKLAEGKIISIQRLPYGGLYEVTVQRGTGHTLVYTDESAKLVVIGRVIETASDRDLTAERLRALSSIEWGSLPFDRAITMKRGSGRREVAIFSDPNCPYCERFERDLARLDDITVHIFIYPVVRPDSVRQVKAVWCSQDRVKAWNDLMFRRIEPQAKPDCATPVDELLALGRRLGANVTPTWFLRNGQRSTGAMGMAEFVPLLDAATAAAEPGRPARGAR